MDVVEVDVDDNVEHVVENTPYITLVHTSTENSRFRLLSLSNKTICPG